MSNTANTCCATGQGSWMQRLSTLPATLLSGFAVLMSLLAHFYGTPLAELLLSLVAVLISGTPVVSRALRSLFKERRITASLLITIGMIAAIAIGEYFAAAEVAFIMALGEYLEDRALDKSKSSLFALLELVPTHARRLHPETREEEDILASEVRLGDLLRILPGESIPSDSVVEHGESSVDQSVLTGESLPLDKTVGSELLCGTTNLYGVLEVRCTRETKDSSLNKMLHLVEEASKSKSPIQRQADKWASALVPIALLIAVLTYIFTGQIINAVTVLVVFCPCALVLATPVSIMAAIGHASKNGVLIKHGAALEELGSLSAIVFDKTGTLTQGALRVSDTHYFGDITQRELDTWIARAEKRSEHPLAKALMRHYKEQYADSLLTNDDVRDDFRMLPGQGVHLQAEGREILCGNESLMRQHAVRLDDSVAADILRLRSEGKALIFVAMDQTLVALIALSDTLRQGALELVPQLQSLGMSVSMMTGDNQVSAQYLASQMGIEEVHGELLPEDKLKRIREKQEAGHQVAMLGDGVNDAAALKAADVGIAMAKAGSDIAIDSADVALYGEDISKLVYLRKLSRATLGSIRFNIALSLVLNIAAVTLAVAGLIGPVIGALLHNVGSVLVVLNASRLAYSKKFT